VGIVEKIIGFLFVVPSTMLSTVSTLSSHSLGAGDVLGARRVLRRALAVTIVFGVFAAIVMQWMAGAAVSLFTDDAHVITLGDQYLRSYSWDCLFAGIHFCFSGYFCACGWAIVSFVHNLASIILARIPLSYLFSVQYPDTLYPMGWAPGLGSALSVVICVVVYAWLLRHRPAVQRE